MEDGSFGTGLANDFLPAIYITMTFLFSSFCVTQKRFSILLLPLKITFGEERVTGLLTSLVSVSGGTFKYSAPKTHMEFRESKARDRAETKKSLT